MYRFNKDFRLLADILKPLLIVLGITGLLSQVPQERTIADGIVPEHVTITEAVAEIEKEVPPLAEPAKAVVVPKPVVKPVVTHTVTGNKQDWLLASGIPQAEWHYVDYIVTKESGWNPLAVNKSSGACSLAQALPCGKIGSDWRNPVTALRWQYNYVLARYGSYAKAYSFWVANQWY
jgi:hypothetical protein